MKVRVCMIAATFLPVVGGAQIQAGRLAGQLQQQGHSLWILTRRLKKTPPVEIVQGIEVVRAPVLGSGVLGSLSFFFTALCVLFRRRKTYDVIHVHMMYSQAVIGAVAGVLLRKPVLVKNGLGGDLGELQCSRKSLWGRLKLAFLKRTLKAFASISREIQEEFIDLGFPSSRLVVIPNGVDTSAFSPNPAKKEEPPRILFTGRFIPEKGIFTLLEAFSCIAPRPHSPELFLIGDGPLKKEAQERVQTMGVENRVSFPGVVTDPTRYYREGDIFVLLSCREGLSNALLEAMAGGLAIVGSLASGMRDAVEDGRNGYLVSYGDKKALQEKLDLLCTKPDLRMQMGRESRRIAVEKFSMERVGKKYEELYHQLLDQHTCLEKKVTAGV